MVATQEIWISTERSVELLNITFNHVKWEGVTLLITEDRVLLSISSNIYVCECNTTFSNVNSHFCIQHISHSF